MRGEFGGEEDDEGVIGEDMTEIVVVSFAHPGPAALKANVSVKGTP